MKSCNIKVGQGNVLTALKCISEIKFSSPPNLCVQNVLTSICSNQVWFVLTAALIYIHLLVLEFIPVYSRGKMNQRKHWCFIKIQNNSADWTVNCGVKFVTQHDYAHGNHFDTQGVGLQPAVDVPVVVEIWASTNSINHSSRYTCVVRIHSSEWYISVF